MEVKDLKKEFEEQCKFLNLELTKKQEEQFFQYMNLLIEWNEKINLTAIIEPKEIIQKHFIDSLTIMPYIKGNEQIVDIGTGAGFPGIPIKIKEKEVNITLLDSLNKRLTFLKEVINKLELNNIKTLHGRAEEIGKNKQYRETFDIATSRAVAPLNILIEYLLPMVKVGGKCICMKGNNCKEEIEKSKKAIDLLGGKIDKVEDFCLPKSDINRTIIIIKKIRNTPNEFPRKAGIPSKQPIE